GQLLALLEAEGVLLPVRAPHAGCLQGWCVSARQPVVRGQPILYLSHERRR
ncbi:acetyl-CoA carboxylase biotin carboxyl carrier protein subunit, partial [Xanthomonas sp. Kuri4-3]